MDFTTEYSLQSVLQNSHDSDVHLAMNKNLNPKHLYDEQQTLIAEIERHTEFGNAGKILGAAISVMNLMEGVIESKGKGATPTLNPDVALAGAQRFVKRLQTSDEKELIIAEALSRSSSLQSTAEWGVKLARVAILAEYLWLKSPKSFGVIANVSIRNLISNLQKMSLIEPTDEVSTVPIFDIQISDWFDRTAGGATKIGGPKGQLNNKWLDGKVVWAAPTLPSYLDEFSGVVPWQVVLDPRVGFETAVFIMDRTPFAHQIAQLKPFHLNLKTGLVPCPSGPVFFMLYWLRNPSGEGCFTSFEQTINPHNSKHLQPPQDLARQSHWHVFVLGRDNEELNWFEFENRFELDKSLSQLTKVISDYPCLDFDKAKMEFQERFTMDDLFNL